MRLRKLLTTVIATVAMMWSITAMAQSKEAYVVRSNDGGTITFYYDTKKSTHPSGYVYDIPSSGNTPDWAGTYEKPNETLTHVVFDESFNNYQPTSTFQWFSNCQALIDITGIENLNTSSVTDMSYMFNMCFELTSINAKTFDTSNVTNMGSMFSSCVKLSTLDVSNFDTSSVTNMSNMFYGCEALPLVDVLFFMTDRVTNMKYMFSGCRSMESIDLENFNTENVTDMGGMFADCGALKTLDVSNFNTKNVENMSGMFSGCKTLNSINVTKFNTSNVTSMASMFWHCVNLKSLDLAYFDVSKVTDMERMFQSCSNLQTIYSNNTWTCASSYNMFDGCTQLKGAVPFDPAKVDAAMANPKTGYFTLNPTGIETTKADVEPHKKGVYTVGGIRVSGELKDQPKGIYIVNGKKVIK